MGIVALDSFLVSVWYRYGSWSFFKRLGFALPLGDDMSAQADRLKTRCVCLVQVRYLVTTALRDGEITIGLRTDQCRRQAVDEDLCWQHAKSADREPQD
jgi:hypothetical protein